MAPLISSGHTCGARSSSRSFFPCFLLALGTNPSFDFEFLHSLSSGIIPCSKNTPTICLPGTATCHSLNPYFSASAFCSALCSDSKTRTFSILAPVSEPFDTLKYIGLNVNVNIFLNMLPAPAGRDSSYCSFADEVVISNLLPGFALGQHFPDLRYLTLFQF